MCHLEEEKSVFVDFPFFQDCRKRANVHHFDFRKSNHLQPVLAATCSLLLQPRGASVCEWLQVAAAVCSGSEPFAAVCYLEKSDFVDVCRFYFFFKIVCSGGLAASRHLAAATCPDWNICINGCFDQKSFTGPDCLYLRVSVYLQPANWRPVK